jgi:hypothetical protein
MSVREARSNFRVRSHLYQRGLKEPNRAEVAVVKSVCRGYVYLVNGESDAPAAEEQRAPANGWCDLLMSVCVVFLEISYEETAR